MLNILSINITLILIIDIHPHLDILASYLKGQKMIYMESKILF